MKLTLIGKTRAVTHWLEDCAAGFAEAGHQVQVLSSRDPRLSPALDRMLLNPALGAPRAAWIACQVRRFAPDLVLFVGALPVDQEILDRLHAQPNRPPLAIWVGDAFDPARALGNARCFDLIAYTDSGFLTLHHTAGFAAPALYLPHAANIRLGAVAVSARAPLLAFVANPTPQRVALLGGLREKVALFGPGWRPFADVDHVITARRIGIDELAQVYASHMGVLNIRHEINVFSGLNQRSFDPYLLRTPVVSDDQPDLAACFEPGREVLIYRSAGELDEISRQMRDDPDWARSIGEAGYRRVMAEHNYGQRLARLAAAVGVARPASA